MARRREEEPPKGSPAWMNTFSDLMNLLLCFFVLLFSMSVVQEEKWDAFVSAMNNTFSIWEAGATAIGDGVLISNGVSQLNELDQYINSTGKTAESEVDGEQLLEEFEKTPEAVEEVMEEKRLQENEQLAEMVQETVVENNMVGQIEVSFNANYVQLTMKGALLFESGSAEVKEEAKTVLDKAGIILERYGAETTIEIEGHTDNVPISSARFADNEELSSARALSVFYYLTNNTSLDPVRLKHAGMGERVPIADNSTPEGRSKNRRVELRIYNPS